nr:PIN domain-containing protein [Acetobacter persici]
MRSGRVRCQAVRSIATCRRPDRGIPGCSRWSRREVERLAARLAVLPFDSEAAAHTADIRTELERNGRIIGPYDLMIARYARSRGLIVVTGNLREFQLVDGLRTEGWLTDTL